MGARSKQRRDDRPVSRRGALCALAGAAAGTLAVGTAAAQSDGGEFGGWFDDVSNYDGVVDRTGQSEVTVDVGASGNGGNLAFGPAAVRVDPGTTVVWEWTGEGGAHNVVAEDGTFDSGEAVTDASTTFEHTFESEGTFRYVCEPHEMVGMKGAVVVGGDGDGGGDGSDGGDAGQIRGPTAADKPTGLMIAFAGTLFAMLAAPFVYGATRGYEPAPGGEAAGGATAPAAVTEAPATDDAQVEELGHDEFDPWGTLSLVLVYLGILVGMWLFMYFVEFLGGPTVVGAVGPAGNVLDAVAVVR